MLTDFINVQYCYNYLVDQIPMGILLYSHIPTAIIALLFGGFLLVQERKLPNITLFIVCFTFAAWCVADLVSWFAFLGSSNLMFAWSLIDLFALIFFFFTYYFLYTFITKRDLPLWQKILGVLVIIPTAFWTFGGQNLSSYDANTCEAIEATGITLYPYFVQGFFLLACVVMAIYLYAKSKDKVIKREIVLATTGVVIFLGFFFSSTLGVNYLVNDTAVQYAYNFEIYGLFGMPILLIYLGYLIVRYRAFNLKVIGAQALVLFLIVLIGSEFAFINSLTNRILVGITLVVTAYVGTLLIRGVKKEIEQREHIELLARDLQIANDGQVSLIHFITHQIKGFVTKSRNIFATVNEGDYGAIPETMKPLLKEGFESDTRGLATIQEILNASNIKSGKVTYDMKPFDLKALVEGVLKDLQDGAHKKGIELKSELGSEALTVTGDSAQLVNAYKNIIDNSIKYTPKGSVSVSLTKKDSKALFEVKDTGVGITPEDMKNLFTEGGHGKESAKVNVDSTGFGLYIVKNIVEAHKGRVWAESDGAGKGSRFYIELPL